MPIKFRCPHCQQFLGISRARAGAVTDCPMCGRSIRVPLLDGSVEPLPSPELNLADQGLASALDKLASLVEDDRPAIPSAVGSAPVAPARSVIETAPQPILLPEPIVLSPAPVATTASASGPRTVDDALDSVARLGHPVRPEVGPSASEAGNRRPGHARMWLTVLGLASAMFACGYWVGRGSKDAPVAEAASTPGPVVAANSPPPQAAVAADPALTGRILYLDGQGESRPDAGARVLVLPEERLGTSKLPVDGLRVGAEEIDRRIALAAVRAAGGDFAVADEAGDFAIHLPRAGLYQLILLSRYQARPEGVAAAAELQTFLARYFDRPLPLIGDGSSHASPFRYDGDETAERDHVFTAP